VVHFLQTLSNFDKYKKEVLSGQLDWSPMHTSDVFWKENVGQFEDRDFAVLRQLLKLLETSREVRQLCSGSNHHCIAYMLGFLEQWQVHAADMNSVILCCRSRLSQSAAVTWACSSLTTLKGATLCQTCAARSWSCA
jgi:hypothetical protein